MLEDVSWWAGSGHEPWGSSSLPAGDAASRDAAGDRRLWNRNDTRAEDAMMAVMPEDPWTRDETANPRGARSNRADDGLPAGSPGGPLS